MAINIPGAAGSAPINADGMAGRPSAVPSSNGLLVDVASSRSAAHMERLMSGAVLGACMRVQLGMWATSRSSASKLSSSAVPSGSTRK